MIGWVGTGMAGGGRMMMMVKERLWKERERAESCGKK
jgi:hypothetical protein